MHILKSRRDSIRWNLIFVSRYIYETQITLGKYIMNVCTYHDEQSDENR